MAIGRRAEQKARVGGSEMQIRCGPSHLAVVNEDRL